jgi:hypothetical protein
MAARGIAWIAPTDREMTLRNKGATLTDAAVAKALQGEKHCWGKIVIDHQCRDIVVHSPAMRKLFAADSFAGARQKSSGGNVESLSAVAMP